MISTLQKRLQYALLSLVGPSSSFRIWSHIGRDTFIRTDQLGYLVRVRRGKEALDMLTSHTERGAPSSPPALPRSASASVARVSSTELCSAVLEPSSATPLFGICFGIT